MLHEHGKCTCDFFVGLFNLIKLSFPHVGAFSGVLMFMHSGLNAFGLTH